MQRPVEVEAEPDTKYRFDYTVQVPEAKPEEQSARTHSGRVDRLTDPKKGELQEKSKLLQHLTRHLFLVSNDRFVHV